MKKLRRDGQRLITIGVPILLTLFASGPSVLQSPVVFAEEPLGQVDGHDDVEAAIDGIQTIFGDLVRVSHHDPYTVSIDRSTGIIILDNRKVRWKANLRDLSEDIIVEPYKPGIDGYSRGSVIHVPCRSGRRCVWWGAYRGEVLNSQTWRQDHSRLSFQIYRGLEGDFAPYNRDSRRDIRAEEQVVEAFRVLVLAYRE